MMVKTEQLFDYENRRKKIIIIIFNYIVGGLENIKPILHILEYIVLLTIKKKS